MIDEGFRVYGTLGGPWRVEWCGWCTVPKVSGHVPTPDQVGCEKYNKGFHLCLGDAQITSR